MTPISWLPTASSSMLGLFSLAGVPHTVQFYAAGMVGCLSMSAMISLFENRHNVIQNNRFRISKQPIRFLIVGINYLFAVVYPIPFLFGLPDQDSAKLSILQTIACPSEEFFQLPVFTISINPEFKTYAAISMFICTVFMMFQLKFYASTCIYYLVLSKSKNSSKVTIDRQRKFFYGILIQISIPYLFMLPAIGYTCYSIFRNYYNQGKSESCDDAAKFTSDLNNFFILFANFYGTVATFALLFSHTPYRDFFRKVICWEKTKPIGKISTSGNRPSAFIK
ncbi:Protein CBR-SRH-76 [Caenorhabditis briggsae]|uniref:Protein CBR-SRH-76 n=2 Tax=Caenorhabditis briggsae TaxID=6238 RepID=A8X9E3_CAEBR|nr:Protein CBR-SRH-76 [Caenorhabditis briggsae]ULT90073.1 hypothetical protein L3Y34_008449 [Caenorhabditis briggsae]CAP29255.1 Protein CBR-SRH-76 [Caenorhabditis briggsae]